MKRAIFLLALVAGTAAAEPAPLVPAACGVRQTLWIEHYAAQLHVPAGKTAAALHDPQQPKMLRMRILNSMLMPSDIPRRWRDALQPVLDAETMRRLRAGYRTLQEGDTVVVTYEPQRGVKLRINERTVADAKGHGAIDALLAAWAHNTPVEQKLAGTVSRNPCA